jgi:uncharacterized protein (TIGR00251 family)
VKISVLVKPRSQKSEVVSYEDNVLKVRVAAIPHKQASNKELIKVLSKFFDVPKSRITIVGRKSKIKIVSLDVDSEDIALGLKKLL